MFTYIFLNVFTTDFGELEPFSALCTIHNYTYFLFWVFYHRFLHFKFYIKIDFCKTMYTSAKKNLIPAEIRFIKTYIKINLTPKFAKIKFTDKFHNNIANQIKK